MVRSPAGDPLHDRQATRHSHGRPPVPQRLLFVPLLNPSASPRRPAIPFPNPSLVELLRLPLRKHRLRPRDAGRSLRFGRPEPFPIPVAGEAPGFGPRRRAAPQPLLAAANLLLARNFPKVIDSLEFRIVEICREYRLEYSTSCIVPGVRKVVVSPDCVWTGVDELEVYSIVDEGRLGYWKYGDENWTYLDDQHGCSYDDIIVYEGKVCVVDSSGAVSLIDSSLRTQKFSPSICSDGGSSGNCKHLVVSRGDLYVVDMCFGGNLGGYEIDAYMDDFSYPSFKETFDFRVYRLDQRCRKWVEVRSLGNMAFFLSKHCSYAISMDELGGCNGNCIYFMENAYSPFSRGEVNVFSLHDRSIKWLVFSDFLMSTRATPDLTHKYLLSARNDLELKLTEGDFHVEKVIARY